jgi:hypothetical protein
MHRFTRIAACAAALATPLVFAAAVPASASTPSSFTAATSVTSRDDSGTNSNGTTNNWAADAFTRTAHITFHNAVGSGFCPGIPGSEVCHSWTGSLTDSGTFTTVPGDAVPGQGSLNGGAAPLIGEAVTGHMQGTINFKFYSSAGPKLAADSNVPSALSGDTPSTGQWVEQFFPAGTSFWDTSGNTGGSEYLGVGGSWTYTEALGADSACPNVAGRWVDANATSWGSLPADGNILAPDASSC